MILKASFQLAFLAIEVILTFYSNVLEDSLMAKFLLFVITAVLIAMGVTKLADNLLPADKDFVSGDQEEGND
jgi:membrane protein implicated in regulation of membrane protease activity